MPVEQIGLLVAIGASLTWGLVYVFDQKILTELSPVTLLFAQALLTVFVLAPFVYLQGDAVESIRNVSKTTGVFLLGTLVLTVLANMLILYSIQYLGAATASMLEITYPLFVVFFALLFFGTLPSVYVLIGGILILIGAMLVAYFT